MMTVMSAPLSGYFFHFDVIDNIALTFIETLFNHSAVFLTFSAKKLVQKLSPATV